MTEANGQDDLDQLVHLSPRQAAAAEIIAAGGTQQDAAKQLGVARETVCRWHKHPEFTAVLNRHRSEALREHAAGIHRLRNSALDVVEGALDSNDTRVALRVLDTLGMSPASCGPTDARAIFDEEVRRISFDLP